MDPGFVERHWNDLPNLKKIRDAGGFQRLPTTTPPQSPVAWSTFITGLDPGDHGIFDFVHRNPSTHELFLSTGRTIEPNFRIPLGPWEIPLRGGRVESLRRGAPFWKTLADRGVPVMVIRMPTNYPPLHAGREIAGMGAPDLRGTQGAFAFYTDAADQTTRNVSGGLIRRVAIVNHHVDLTVEGPPNSLRRDRVYSTTTLTVDIDPEQPVARLQAGEKIAILREGEWSGWIPVEFPLIPHVISARGMFRVFARQLHPGFELYISPVNIDPTKPVLPVAYPASFGADLGRFYTLGIPEDTASIRQGIFDLPQFLAQTRLVWEDERRMLNQALDRFEDGFLFFYFSSVDENSHILWGKHDGELLKIYHKVDDAIGEVLRREPRAALMVMSDHGFSSFDRAVNLNTWLLEQGLLARAPDGKIDWEHTKAYAMGLNALYLTGADRDELKRRLLAWRDPRSGRQIVETASATHPAPANRAIAPDLIVGYAPGYRASWATGLGETPETDLEDNNDPWIADHCINSTDVPGVLFTRGLRVSNPSLKNLSSVILGLFP